MCSIGWLKLTDSWILFKNRDRVKGEPKRNVLIEDEDIMGFGDEGYPGIWLGMNRHGIGISTAYGPRMEVPKGMKPENFQVSERVLRETKSVEDAAKMYLEEMKNTGRSFNVVICDAEHSVALEIIQGKSSSETGRKMIARTNYFVLLNQENPGDEREKRSRARYAKLMELLPSVDSSEDLMQVLKFHSENDLESICRHDSIETVASAIYEVRGKKVDVFYILNDFPHNRSYEHKTFSLF